MVRTERCPRGDAAHREHYWDRATGWDTARVTSATRWCGGEARNRSDEIANEEK